MLGQIEYRYRDFDSWFKAPIGALHIIVDNSVGVLDRKSDDPIVESKGVVEVEEAPQIGIFTRIVQPLLWIPVLRSILVNPLTGKSPLIALGTGFSIASGVMLFFTGPLGLAGLIAGVAAYIIGNQLEVAYAYENYHAPNEETGSEDPIRTPVEPRAVARARLACPLSDSPNAQQQINNRSIG